MLTGLTGHLDCTTRKLRIAVGLLPAYLATLIASVSAFAEFINDLPDFCLTTACSLRRMLIVQDFQHISSLNLARAGLSTRMFKMPCSLRYPDKTVSSAFAIHRLAPVDSTADNRVRTTAACAAFSPRDLPTGHLFVFFDYLDAVASVRLDVVSNPAPGLRQQRLPVRWLRCVPFLRPKPKTGLHLAPHSPFLQSPSNRSLKHSASSATATLQSRNFHHAAAGPFPLETLGWVPRQNRPCDRLLLWPNCGLHLVSLNFCPSRDSSKRLRLERFRTSHARVDVNVLS